MRKSKRRKIKNEKCEISKIHIENRQKTMHFEDDRERVENEQDASRDITEKEQRRTTRLGAIITIVAVIGTICVFLFKLTTNLLNVWSVKGLIYWYLQALFLLALSTAVIIFIDIVLYVVNDLKRYNILDQNYKQYDQESDNRYMHLLSDFRIYTIMILSFFAFCIPLSIIYGVESQRWSGILSSCLCVVAGVVLVVRWIQFKSREEIKRSIRKVGIKTAKWIYVALLSFVVSTVFIVNNEATICVSYNADGIVEICNTSAESYNGLDIEIENEDEMVIYAESVEKGKLLIAREDKYVNNKVDGEKEVEGILLNSEYMHWKYTLDLKKIINESGKYCVSITVYQDGKRADLSNSLFVENNEYVFAKDDMEKEY